MSQVERMVWAMQAASNPAKNKAALILNRQKLDELRRANGIATEVELANIIGVDGATLWHASNGRPVSGSFIAGVMVAFPHATIDFLFTVRAAA